MKTKKTVIRSGLFLLSASLIAAILTSCLFSSKAKDVDDNYLDREWASENADLSFSAHCRTNQILQVSFSNKSGKTVKILTDVLSFYTEKNQTSYRLLPSETKSIFTDLSLPDFIIPPQKTVLKTFVAVYDYKNPKKVQLLNFIDYTKCNSGLIVAYRFSDETVSNYLISKSTSESAN